MGDHENRHVAAILLSTIVRYHCTSMDAKMLLPVLHLLPTGPLTESYLPPSTEEEVSSSNPECCKCDESADKQDVVESESEATNTRIHDVELVSVLANVADHTKINSYFSFDGIDGYICLGPFDKFPSTLR
eukprot:NODE_2520_length_421_cov_19.360215_g2439_i0.p1 GENE.NODE_2520_length_421_cov_19.360215_g2439_i0~~NODE_2520_length_421_cov_19.360215_g2439_i0.p1  ORF type:complete len:139 (+),score=26.13 NODE_2520_length_421_cov_19.360215_g2439_i0:25-417(+)